MERPGNITSVREEAPVDGGDDEGRFLNRSFNWRRFEPHHPWPDRVTAGAPPPEPDRLALATRISASFSWR